MTVTSREPEASAVDIVSRKDLRQVARQRRLKLVLQGLSVASAFVGAFVLLFVGGFMAWQGVLEDVVPFPNAVEDDVAPIVAEPVSPGFDVGALEDRLREIAEEHEGVYGVAVLEPVSGTRISLRGEEEFAGASIAKLPSFAALYRAAAGGELDLEEEISIQYDDYQSYGSGSLHALPVGHSLSLRECAYYLVNHSDNTAWAMLDRRLGEEKIQAELEGMELEDSRYQGHLDSFYTTPEDVLRLLERISDPAFTSEEYSTEMLDAMTDTLFEDRIPEKLPDHVRVAHKIGSYGVNFGDAGVVFHEDEQGIERRYYLVVLTKGAGEYEVRDAIQEMSLTIYETLTETTVDPAWSRGTDTRPENVVEAPPTAPPPVPPPAENAGPAAKPPLQEKPAPKVEKQPPRYDTFYYPPPEYAPYQDSKDYYWEEY